ncbi:PAS domain S-box protein [Rhodococcus sp. NPDC058514]|uniref:PAS domain S-box protein n=1 Tax=unclassified Rhodococcus (in: high G+C Gram-positive bacteria) TaxID=192944 RepID=UPI00365B73EF
MMDSAAHYVSPEEYRHLLARTQIAMMMHDQNSRMLEVNQAFADLLGYSLAEVERLDARDVVHPDDHADRARETDALTSGAVDCVTVPGRKLRRKDGTAVWVRVHKSVVRRDGTVKIMAFYENSWVFELWREPGATDPE